MNKEALKTEILIQCQNVQCGAKLAAEIHFVYKETEIIPEDILLFEETLKHFPELKYFASFHPDKQAKKDGWKSLFIFKYEPVAALISEIESIENKESSLYHFCNGKLFGYNDFEVMNYLGKNKNGTINDR